MATENHAAGGEGRHDSRRRGRYPEDDKGSGRKNLHKRRRHRNEEQEGDNDSADDSLKDSNNNSRRQKKRDHSKKESKDKEDSHRDLRRRRHDEEDRRKSHKKRRKEEHDYRSKRLELSSKIDNPEPRDEHEQLRRSDSKERKEKKHKKEKKKKSKKTKKILQDTSTPHTKIPDKALLVNMGMPRGQPPEEPVDPEDDYFTFHQHFWVYLFREEGRAFNDLTSEETHTAFARFAEAYNNGNLEVDYYKLPLPAAALEEAKTTKHKWSFVTAAADDNNNNNETAFLPEWEERRMQSVQAAVRKQTESSMPPPFNDDRLRND